jgi:phytanoyl-CoA hydroxylase
MNDLSLFFKRGFVVLKDFWLREDLKLLLSQAREVFAYQMEPATYSDFQLFELFRRNPQTFKNCGKHVQHLPLLHQMGVHSRVLSLVKSLGVSSPCIATRPVLYFHHPKLAENEYNHKTPAHQDIASMQGSCNSVVVWFPLDKLEGRGFLEVVPESHKNGNLAKDFTGSFGNVAGFEDGDFQQVKIELGDVLVFSTSLVHRSGLNEASEPRWTASFRYNDLADKAWAKKGFPHPYVYYPDPKLCDLRWPSHSDMESFLKTRIGQN